MIDFLPSKNIETRAHARSGFVALTVECNAAICGLRQEEQKEGVPIFDTPSIYTITDILFYYSMRVRPLNTYL